MRLKPPVIVAPGKRKRWRQCLKPKVALGFFFLLLLLIFVLPRPPALQAEQAAAAAVITDVVALEYFSSPDCSFPDQNLLRRFELSDAKEGEEFQAPPNIGARGIRINAGRAEFFHHADFVYTLYATDGCARVYNFPAVSHVRLYRARTSNEDQAQVSQSALQLQRRSLLPGISQQALDASPAKFRVVFSCESSEYFGYQVYANKLAFMQSQMGNDATWTRLLTCQSPDDIAQDVRFPTFQAPAHPYARRYSPLNKPDVIEKWFLSKLDAPKEDVIVVIDPDSWLLNSLFENHVSRVSPGHALGQAAYYSGSSLPQTLWREFCEENCDLDMDLVGVPYVVHRLDLQRIAPLWKHYVLKIKYRLEHSEPESNDLAKRYAALDLRWATEMYAYNMASAHLGIKHTVVSDLQVRDVEGPRGFKENAHQVSIHVGRAWFKRNAPEAKQWLHTEGRGFAYYGDQVWCKCNYTASTVKPWPIPSSGVDFQSYHTLRLLHESELEYGPVPDNEQWRRRRNLKLDYKWTHP